RPGRRDREYRRQSVPGAGQGAGRRRARRVGDTAQVVGWVERSETHRWVSPQARLNPSYKGQAMPEQRSDNPTDLFKLLRGKSPEEAKFFWSGGPIEVAERTWFQSVFSGCTGFETDEGVVLVDSGMVQLGGKLAALLRQKTGAPIHTAI